MINYFIDWQYGIDDGVSKKVLSQLANMNAAGSTPVILNICTFAKFAEGWGNFEHVRTTTYFSKFGRLTRRIQILLDITNSKNSQILYLRGAIFLPHELYLIRKNRYVVEINSKGLTEYRMRNWLLFAYAKLCYKILIKNSAGAICLTREILLQMTENYPGVPSIVVPNGISTFTSTVNRKMHARFKFCYLVGHHSPWQGLDKFIDLAHLLPSCDFYIIGNFDKQNFFPDNLYLVGYLSGKALQDFLMEMDVGISTLELSKKNMEEACPLKTREYLGAGLPVAGAYIDTGISNGSKFFHRIILENGIFSPSEATKLFNFAMYWSDKRITYSDIASMSDNLLNKERYDFLISRI